MGVNRNALGRLDQQVLQGRGGIVLAANSDESATFALGSLFTLITKHGKTPGFEEVMILRFSAPSTMQS
jgi:hypothetical protein